MGPAHLVPSAFIGMMFLPLRMVTLRTLGGRREGECAMGGLPAGDARLASDSPRDTRIPSGAASAIDATLPVREGRRGGDVTSAVALEPAGGV